MKRNKIKFTEKLIREVIMEEISLTIETHLEKAIEKGVINALKSFGADADNQHEVQKDFHYLRKMRKRSEVSGYMLMKALISVTIAASVVAIWEGVKIILHT
jgi:hypothetical protein